MKRTALALMLILPLSLSAVAGTQFVKFARADPIPSLYSIITIENPQNTTYNRNTITINFSVDFLEFLNNFDYSYSLDGQVLKPIENITTVSEEHNPFFIFFPGIHQETLKGSFVLSNLTEGWHNVTIYQTYYHPFTVPFDRSASLKFMIIQEPTPSLSQPFPTAYSMGIVAVIVLILLGSIVYILKRK
jgi:hypothetical protein